MTLIPELETERCYLRAPAEQDLVTWTALRAHPQVFQYSTLRPSTEEEVWRRITGVIGHWTLRGYGMWAIEDKASGEFIGETGFADNYREGFGSRRGLPEAGWWLAANRHGLGFAREVVRAAHAWADSAFTARCTFCGIMSANLASIRLAEHIGYVFQEETAYLGQRAFVYERTLRPT